MSGGANRLELIVSFAKVQNTEVLNERGLQESSLETNDPSHKLSWVTRGHLKAQTHGISGADVLCRALPTRAGLKRL